MSADLKIGILGGMMGLALILYSQNTPWLYIPGVLLAITVCTIAWRHNNE